jgi:hypothetical protein
VPQEDRVDQTPVVVEVLAVMVHLSLSLTQQPQHLCIFTLVTTVGLLEDVLKVVLAVKLELRLGPDNTPEEPVVGPVAQVVPDLVVVEARPLLLQPVIRQA